MNIYEIEKYNYHVNDKQYNCKYSMLSIFCSISIVIIFFIRIFYIYLKTFISLFTGNTYTEGSSAIFTYLPLLLLIIAIIALVLAIKAIRHNNDFKKIALYTSLIFIIGFSVYFIGHKEKPVSNNDTVTIYENYNEYKEEVRNEHN